MRDLPPGIKKHSSRDGYEVRMRFKDPFTGESKRASAYAKSLVEAKRKQREMMFRIDNHQSPVDATMNFGKLVEHWLDRELPHQGLKPNTQDLYSGLARKHILGSNLERLKVSSVTPSHLDEFFRNLERSAGQSLRRNLYSALSHIFRLALRNALIAKSPLELVRRPAQKKQEVRFLSQDELTHLMRELEGSRYWKVARLILLTGIRRGEALGLSWADVDFEQSQIHIRHTLDSKGRRGAPKTARSIRTLELHKPAVDLLKEVRKTQIQNRLKLGTLFEGCSWDPVFTTDDGKATQPRVFLRAIQAAAERSGLNPPGTTEKVGVHTLRHFVASQLLSNGFDMMVVSRILGHESIKTTVDIYGHLQDSLRKQALSSLA